MQCCPACGQTLPPEQPFLISVRGKQLILIEALRKAGAHGLPSDVLFERIYADDINGGPETGIKTLHVTVCQLNKKLNPLGWRIKATYQGRGGPADYRLERIPNAS